MIKSFFFIFNFFQNIFCLFFINFGENLADIFCQDLLIIYRMDFCCFFITFVFFLFSLD